MCISPLYFTTISCIVFMFFSKQRCKHIKYLFFKLFFIYFRYITVDELEDALTKHNMGDEATIRDIIAEVDTDRVSYIYETNSRFGMIHYSFFCYYLRMLNLFNAFRRMDE